MADYYDLNNHEHFVHTHVEDCVEAWLDTAPLEVWPRTLVVHALTRKQVLLQDRVNVLRQVEDVLSEYWHDRFGNPDKPEVLSAEDAKALRDVIDRILHTWGVWQCARTPDEDVTVDVPTFVREHCSHWLEDKLAGQPFHSLSPSAADIRAVLAQLEGEKMMNDTFAEELVMRLNSAIEDPTVRKGIIRLMDTYISMPQKTEEHPALCVTTALLGLLNDLVSITDKSTGIRVIARYSEAEDLEKFVVVTGR